MSVHLGEENKIANLHLQSDITRIQKGECLYFRISSLWVPFKDFSFNMYCFQRLVVTLRILQKGGGKQLRAEFTVQEDASTREFSPQVTIFNLLLLDNVNAQVFWRLDFDDFALREIKKIGRFGKVLRLCQQESPSILFLCCKSSSRKIVYRKHNIIGADSEKNNFPFDGSLKSN